MTTEAGQFKIKAQKINAKMAELLKESRTEERYTMRALSEKIGTPHSFIGKTEHQNRRLDVGEFIQYCHALEADPVVIFKALVKAANAA